MSLAALSLATLLGLAPLDGASLSDVRRILDEPSAAGVTQDLRALGPNAWSDLVAYYLGAHEEAPGDVPTHGQEARMLEAVAALAPVDAVAQLRGGLDPESSLDRRLRVLRVLGHLSSDEAFGAFVELVAELEPALRRSRAGERGVRAGLEPLVLGEPARVGALVEGLRDASVPLDLTAPLLETLEGRSVATYAPALLDLLALAPELAERDRARADLEPRTIETLASLRALGDSKLESALADAIEVRLHVPDSATRAAAVRALGRRGSFDAAERLLPMLSDEDVRVSHAASLALAGLGGPDHRRDARAWTEFVERERAWRDATFAELRRVEAGCAPAEAHALLRELAKRPWFAADALDALASLARHADSGVAQGAIRTLAGVERGAAVEMLLSALDSNDTEVQRAACDALATVTGLPAQDRDAWRGWADERPPR